MIGRARRRFVALLEPGSVHVVEFSADADGIEIQGRGSGEALPPGTLADATAALARLIESRGGRKGRATVVVRGFGVSHHILRLPPASRDVWAPIVKREVTRLEPQLVDARVSFVECGTVDRGTTPARDILAAAAPEAVLRAVSDALSKRQIEVEHVTIVPQAIRQAFGELDDGRGSAVVLAMLESGPIVCFFHGGELRLVVEPPVAGARGDARTQAVHGSIERGLVHLRQQFRGARPERLLVAAPAGEEAALADELRRMVDQQAGLEVVGIGAPESLVALGAVCDLESEHSLDLRGRRDAAGAAAAADPPRRRFRHRPLAAAVVAAALVWALIGGYAAWSEGREVESLERQASERAASLGRVLPTLEARRAEDVRVSYLQALDEDYIRLEGVLRELGTVVPPALRLDRLELNRAETGWRARAHGRATGRTSADALAVLQSLSSGVERQLRTTARLEDFEYIDGAGTDDGRPGVRFRLSFSVPFSAGRR